MRNNNCPFCGGDDLTVFSENWENIEIDMVFCFDCKCQAPLSKWNTRTDPVKDEMITYLISQEEEYERCIDAEIWEDEFQEEEIKEGFKLVSSLIKLAKKSRT